MGQPQTTLTPVRKPQPGDHIYTTRAGGLYAHHGIYVGNDMVIHLQAPFKGSGSSFMGSASSFMGSGSSSKEIESAPPCQKCGYKPQYCQGGIIKTCLDCFLDGRSSFEFYEYGVPTSYFNNKPRGTCSVSPSKPDHEVVERATDLLERKGFGEYNLIVNNCEHFAVYCKTGLASSQQVQAAGDAITQIAEPLGKGLLCTGAIFAVPAVCLVAKAITGAQRRP
ncbi:PREDICTED: HRAS-like suppressor 3 isoform X1 [Theobroma cacao]|uniref:HRAS-like suppressor 3 isoform X1 n=1 Tax=Theobroma cacao TaxID=3641 RepID=A0AB32V5B1_THECC|nr:PREDICTED: HRAS-like suppressor 3 isoform X2 [Theobroma cacao]XP_017976276.1 PREDICTED: HRAS-like suppressor 3 isoform X1 [Theobroma cacao]